MEPRRPALDRCGLEMTSNRPRNELLGVAIHESRMTGLFGECRFPSQAVEVSEETGWGRSRSGLEVSGSVDSEEVVGCGTANRAAEFSRPRREAAVGR